MRTSEALLSEGGAAQALEGAVAVMQHLAEAGGGGGGAAAAAAQPAAAPAGTAGSRAAKLMVRALQALGRHGEAGARLIEWLDGGGCPDARAAAGALGAYLEGWDATRPRAAEELSGAAAAAARAFPGRHEPAMAVVEWLLAPGRVGGRAGAGMPLRSWA
jgi:hypothetical protein